MEQARAEGLVRYIGITGHACPELPRHTLTRYDFNTVLVARRMADRLITSPDVFLLPEAVKRNTGVIAMKALGHGEHPGVGLAFHYSLRPPGVLLPIVGMENEQQIDQIAQTAKNFRPLDEAEEEQQVIRQVRPIVEQDGKERRKGQDPLFWLHDTAVMGWREKDEPGLVGC